MATSKPKIVILGSSGNVGQATVQALSNKFGNEVEVIAGVRDPSKEEAKKLGELKGITLAQVDMNDKARVAEVCKGATSAFAITPGAYEREAITKNAIDGCIAAGVKAVATISVVTVEEKDHLFSHQCLPIEEHIKKATDQYIILRLPMFIDNNW